jgi:CRP-like cAMP-binding protein
MYNANMSLGFREIALRMKRISHFKGIKPEDLMEIIRAGQITRFSAGEYIFIESLDCFGICVLLKGEVSLNCLGPEGQENIIKVIKPVIMFNEVAALDGGGNPVTAIAVKDSLVWHADYETFQYGLERFPQLGLGLLPVLARRNRQILGKYSDLSFLEVKERLIRLLLDLSYYGEKVISRKEYSIQVLGSHIATVPALVSRILGDLRKKGLIEATRTEITILKPEELEQIAYLDRAEAE